MSIIKEERISLGSEQNESDDSQNITGSLKENQSVLENEVEYNKNEIIETFNEINQIKKEIKKEIKKVTFKEGNNLVTIIEVKSYKEYNTPIEIGGKKLKKQRKDGLQKKKRKDIEYKKEMEFSEKYYDKYGDSGKSCFIF